MKNSKNTNIMLSPKQIELLAAIALHYKSDVVSKKQIIDFTKIHSELELDTSFIFNNEAFNAGFGKYYVAEKEDFKLSVSSLAEVPKSKKFAANITENMVPAIDPRYVPFGFFNDLKKIIESKIFYPVYITGMSGNGKTEMVQQACAQASREFIRVNITKRTDETDLIGGYELIDGSTVRREGPALIAMRIGAILLLDETDYGSEDLLCLQPILEGKPYFDKKTGEIIVPKEGFNIIATANTKGKGSDDGRYIGANTLNEAFLERFPITVEQEYPDPKIESLILKRNQDFYGVHDDEFSAILIKWADNIRKSFLDGVGTEIISTRRLVNIIRAFKIFNNRKTAVQLCLNRFDDSTKASFMDLYEKFVDEEETKTVKAVNQETKTQNDPNKGNNVNVPPPQKNSTAKTFPNVGAGSAGGTSQSTIPTTPTTVTRQSSAPALTTMSSLPPFADKKILFSVSVDLNLSEPIKITEDVNDFIVLSHEKETRVAKQYIQTQTFPEKVPGTILKMLIGANTQKKAGSIADDYRPYT